MWLKGLENAITLFFTLLFCYFFYLGIKRLFSEILSRLADDCKECIDFKIANFKQPEEDLKELLTSQRKIDSYNKWHEKSRKRLKETFQYCSKSKENNIGKLSCESKRFVRKHINNIYNIIHTKLSGVS